MKLVGFQRAAVPNHQNAASLFAPHEMSDSATTVTLNEANPMHAPAFTCTDTSAHQVTALVIFRRRPLRRFALLDLWHFLSLAIFPCSATVKMATLRKMQGSSRTSEKIHFTADFFSRLARILKVPRFLTNTK